MTAPINTADEGKANEIVQDRGSPRIQVRTERNRIVALLPAIIVIVLVSGAAIGGWLSWRAHRQVQEQSADGNVASKTSIGKRRNDDGPESARRLGADGEAPAPATESPPKVPAIEQDNRRPTPSTAQGQPASPIPVQGNGNQATPEAPPRSRYDAPMRFGAAADQDGAAMSPAKSPGTPGGTTKASSGTRPDYSVPSASLPTSEAAFPSAPAAKGTLNLQTLKTPKAEASLIGNRDYILAKGASFDCDLDTAMRSNQPGMVRCTTIKDVWSDSGNVVLAERGTSITGEYSATSQQGQAEIQVLWNRLKTPTASSSTWPPRRPTPLVGLASMER